MPSSLVRITEPTEAPLSLAEAKAALRVAEEDTDEDALIAGHIRAAADWVEQQLGRALISQVWAYSIDGFPWGYCPQVHLPLGPVQSISEVVYIDSAGVQQVLASAAYVLSADHLWPSYGTTWPTTRVQPGGVVISYTAGFGPSWNDVPEAVRQGIATLVAGYYDGCSAEGAALEMIRPYRAWAF